MFFIFGTKKFDIKKNAYMKSHCKRCETPRAFIQWKWFSMGHIFFIPIIPLGHSYKWNCVACDKEPSVIHETSIFVKIIIILFLAFILKVLFNSEETATMNTETLWGVRAAIFLAIIYFMYVTIKHKQRKLDKIIKHCLPLEDKSLCLNCGGTINDNHPPQCEDCKLIAYDPSITSS